MTLVGTWVNRVDSANKVEIDLNMTDGVNFRRRSQKFSKTPAQVDAAFLATAAAAIIAQEQAAIDFFANVTAFVAANTDLSLFAANVADIDTLIARNSMPYTRAQVRAFMTDLLASANAQAMQAVARQRFG